MLEEKLGHTTKYALLEPFSFNANDIIRLQYAAKRIADYIGLNKMTFIVAIEQLGNKTAGKVDLNRNSDDVYISISRDIIGNDKALLATLAHEISHKYLQIFNISIGNPLLPGYENEVLTDIAAVFLGLGKLLLNGHESEKKYIDADRKTNIKIGYLDGQQLSFVYQLICAMRKTPHDEIRSNLTPNALGFLKMTNNYESRYYNLNFLKN